MVVRWQRAVGSKSHRETVPDCNDAHRLLPLIPVGAVN